MRRDGVFVERQSSAPACWAGPRQTSEGLPHITKLVSRAWIVTPAETLGEFRDEWGNVRIVKRCRITCEFGDGWSRKLEGAGMIDTRGTRGFSGHLSVLERLAIFLRRSGRCITIGRGVLGDRIARLRGPLR